MTRHAAHVTVIGKDKSGLIARICQFLFEAGGNIEELDQHVTHGLFTMHLQVSWPASGHTEAEMEKGLCDIGDELGMEVGWRISNGKSAGPVRIGLLVSKERHAPEAVLAACRDGTVDAHVVAVVSNHDSLADVAKVHGVPFHHIPDADKKAHEQGILDVLRQADVDLVVLARYMRILSPNVVWRYPHRILNIHPSLLPSFPGAVPYRQAVERGVRVAGVTAHLVTVDLDQGPIIAQAAFPVPPRATVAQVAAEGRRREAEILVEGIQRWCDGLEVGWGRAWPR